MRENFIVCCMITWSCIVDLLLLWYVRWYINQLWHIWWEVGKGKFELFKYDDQVVWKDKKLKTCALIYRWVIWRENASGLKHQISWTSNANEMNWADTSICVSGIVTRCRKSSPNSWRSWTIQRPDYVCKVPHLLWIRTIANGTRHLQAHFLWYGLRFLHLGHCWCSCEQRTRWKKQRKATEQKTERMAITNVV